MQKRYFGFNLWLSHEVRRKRNELFPKLRITFTQKLFVGLRWTLMSRLFWGLIVWTLVLSVHYLFIKAYPSYTRFFQLTESNYNNLLEVLIGVLASLLGIGIPILILVVDNISSKRASYLLPSFLRASGIIQTAVLGLAILAVLVGVRFISSLSLIYNPVLSFPVALALTVAMFVVLLELIRIIWRAYNLFSDSYTEKILSSILFEEVQRHFSKDVDYRLATSICEPVYSQFGFYRYYGSGYLRGCYPVYWQKSGTIVDIKLDLLQKALGDERILSVAQFPRGWYASKSFDQVIKGDVAFYVRCNEEQISEISKILIAPFKISRGNRFSSSISFVMELLKNRTLDAIRQSYESEYRTALAHYCEILEISAVLPVIAGSALPFSSLGRWNITFLAIMDLQNVAEVSAQNPQERYIRWLAWSLSEVMTKTLLKGRQDHTGEIPAILELFPAIYHFCIKYDRPKFANAAYEPLLDTFLDAQEFWSVKYIKPSLEAYKRRSDVYFQTIRIVAIILRNAIDNADVESAKRILQKLTLEELGMSMFHYSQWAREKWEISHLLQSNPQEVEELKEELSIRDVADTFAGELERFIRLIRFAASSYVFEGVFQESIQPPIGFQLIQQIWKSVENLEELTTLFLDAYEHYAMSWWSVFDRTPDTKRVYSPNFEQKFFYYFVLKGIDIVARQGLTNPNYGAVKFPEIIIRTKETSDLILHEWDIKWKPIIGIQKKDAEKFLKSLIRFISPPTKTRSVSSLIRKVSNKKKP